VSGGNKIDVLFGTLVIENAACILSEITVTTSQIFFNLLYVLKHCVAYCRNKRDNKVT
jgi:hypothetical protein